MSEPVSMEALRAVRERLAAIHEPGRPVRAIVKRAAALSGLPEAAILSRHRGAHVAWVRFGVMLVANRSISLTPIGRVLDRDHTTIMHGVRRAKALTGSDPAFAAFVAMLGQEAAI